MNTYLEMKTNHVFLTQSSFRQLTDCLARPGKINFLSDPGFTPPPGLYPCSAVFLITLLDGETSLSVFPGEDYWIEYIQLNTGAQFTHARKAEYILLNGREDVPDIADANRGDLLSPEKGATLLFQVDKIEELPSTSSSRITLQGPGVNGVRNLYISGMATSFWTRLQHLNLEYPLGVDFFLLAADGRAIGIPRSSSLSWEVIG